MEQIGMHEAKTRFAEIVRAVRDGGKEFMITSRGEPVAVMTQAERRFSAGAAALLLAGIRSRRHELALAGKFLPEGETVNSFARDGLKW